MRFHLGFSMNIKKLLKYILPILVGIACYFGIFQMQVFAIDTPSNCSDGTLTDYITCSPTGYYEITDDDISSGCNIAFGNPSSNSWGTSQVEFMLEYNVDSNDIGTTNNSNALYLIQKHYLIDH